MQFTMIKRIVCSALFIGLSACVTNSNVAPEAVSASISDTQALLNRGAQYLAQGEHQRAMVEFNKVIALCDDQYHSAKKVYASRSTEETLYYLLLAAKDHQEAIAVASNCADALYIKSYTSLELGLIDEALALINRAITMAPVNAQYLSELGHIYHVKQDWQHALQQFVKAEAATQYSPPALKSQELSRAKRGVGFSLIELGRLNEAEQKFKECLLINPDDQAAINELAYIKKRRAF